MAASNHGSNLGFQDRLLPLVRRHAQGDGAATRPEAEALLADILAAGVPPGDDTRTRCVAVTALMQLDTGDVIDARITVATEEDAAGSSSHLYMVRAQIEHGTGNVHEGLVLVGRAEQAAIEEGVRGHGAECAALAARWRVHIGDLDEAEADLARAMASWDELNPEHQTAILRGHTYLAEARGNPDTAEAFTHRWLALAQKHQLLYQEASAFGELGRRAWRRGERQVAVARFRERQGILRCLDHRVGIVAAANTLGELHRELGEVREARLAYEEALGLLAGTSSESADIIRCNLALLHLEAGDARPAAGILGSLRDRVDAMPVLRVIVALGRVPALLLDGEWGEIDRAIGVAESTVRELSAMDTDVLSLAMRCTEAILSDAASDPQRGRAARLLAFCWEWCERFGRPEAALCLERLRALRGQGATVPLGPFTLLEPLGAGASSTVWLAQHARRRLQVALKVLRADARTGLLESELSAVARLDHPNIVYLLHHGEVGTPTCTLNPALDVGAPWIAMEWVAGGTLAEVAGQLRWSACRTVLLALLDALAHAHARGILHLDLKPANVLLTGRPTSPVPKLADFGLSRALTGPQSRHVAGSPAYMAPEQFLAGPLVPQTDLYALGCLATTLLQGAPPFEEATIDKIREAHTYLPVPPLRARVTTPEGLEGWLQRLLAKSTGARFGSAAEAAWALRALPDVENDEGVLPGAQALPEPSDHWSATTLVIGHGGPTVPVPDGPVPRGIRIPVPAGWQRGFVPDRPRDVVEAGLGLFAVRAPRIIGRVEERSRMWASLAQVGANGRPRIVVLRGPPGSGRRSLCRWLGERSRELGVGVRVVEVTGPMPAREPDTLYLVRGDHPDAVRIRRMALASPLDLGPMPDDDIATALDVRLPLDPALRDLLVRFAQGRPGAAMDQLSRWVDANRLVRRRRGWALRPGTPPPAHVEASS